VSSLGQKHKKQDASHILPTFSKMFKKKSFLEKQQKEKPPKSIVGKWEIEFI
jgi:hypothetical protein